MKAHLLFDIGATNTRLAISTDPSKFEAPVIFDTDSRAHGIEKMLLEIRRMLSGRQVLGAAGGVASPIDRTSGKLINSPNLPLWQGLDLASLIASEIKAPTRIENDTALVGLGEAIAGAGQKAKIVAYLTFSTGINGVRVVDRKIDLSHYGFEIGAQIMQLTQAGSRSVEDIAGGRAVARRYGRSPHEVSDLPVWREIEQAVAAIIYNTVLYWSPDVIVIGGGMTRDLPISRLERIISGFPKVFESMPPILPAELGDFGGLHGALAWLKQK